MDHAGGGGRVWSPRSPPAAFDLVICSEVLERLADVPAALAQLKIVSHGQVLITVPHEPFFRVLARLTMWLAWTPTRSIGSSGQPVVSVG